MKQPLPPPTLRDDGVTIAEPTRACPGCGQPFVPRGRRRWCQPACRQRAYRQRQQPPDEATPALPRRLPKTVIIYLCPECDTRYLGDQYCPDCLTFCHRLGPGAECPHCNEPVAISDIMPVVS